MCRAVQETRARRALHSRVSSCRLPERAYEVGEHGVVGEYVDLGLVEGRQPFDDVLVPDLTVLFRVVQSNRQIRGSLTGGPHLSTADAVVLDVPQPRGVAPIRDARVDGEQKRSLPAFD